MAHVICILYAVVGPRRKKRACARALHQQPLRWLTVTRRPEGCAAERHVAREHLASIVRSRGLDQSTERRMGWAA